jgi:hypothetical protein
MQNSLSRTLSSCESTRSSRSASSSPLVNSRFTLATLAWQLPAPVTMQASASSQPERLLLHRSRAAASSPSPGGDGTAPARTVSPSHDPRLDKRSDDWNAEVTGHAGPAGATGAGKGYLLDKVRSREATCCSRWTGFGG